MGYQLPDHRALPSRLGLGVAAPATVFVASERASQNIVRRNRRAGCAIILAGRAFLDGGEFPEYHDFAAAIPVVAVVGRRVCGSGTTPARE